MAYLPSDKTNRFELLEAIFEALPDPIFVKNNKHQWIYANKPYKTLIGVEDLVGKDDTYVYPPHQVQIFWSEDAKVFQGRHSLNEELVARDVFALTKKFPISLPDGSTGLVGIIFDISSYKKAERIAEQIAAASAAKSRFLAMVSHEIRTPLNGVLGMAQALQEDDLAPQQQEKIATILESGQTLMSIINDLLDMSKIEAGKLEFSPVDCDLRQVVSGVVSLFEPQARAKQIDFNVRFDAETPEMLRFDPVRVRQCISNLVSNAVKFTQMGTIHISVSSEPRALGKRLVIIAVTDTGIGIEENVLGMLFSEFTQADNSTTRQFGGTGLGLAITRRLARLMHGDVTVKSAEGAGSTFTLSFEAHAAAAGGKVEQALSSDSPAEENLSDLRILLVDDNRINRRVARLMLDPSGIQVVEAENGQQALDCLEKQRFDLVLLDVHMPVMDGVETLERVRGSAEPWSRVPIIALTADAMASNRQKLIALGMNGYISKPIDRQSLIAEICSVLGRNSAPARAAS